MRIAIINEHWGAGAARCASDLKSGLSACHEVLCFPRTETETRETVLRGLAEFRPDVVNCHSFYGSLPYGLLADISRAYATCFTVHDPRPIGAIDTECWNCERNAWCLRCPLLRGRAEKLFRNRYCRQRARKRWTHGRCANDLTVVTPSEWMAGRLRRQELSRFRMIHIPNGIDLVRFQEARSMRSRFGLPQNGRILLHLAWRGDQWGVNERKGLRFLAAAFEKQIAPMFPEACLAVAGESIVPNHPRVIPLGMVPAKNIPALLASVDIFVTPTLADNFPYTILEAMAAGKPVVASRVGGISEQVRHGRTGFLVPPGNAAVLGKTLVELLKLPRERREEIGAAGRKKAEEAFSMESFLRAYEALFTELAK